MPNPTAPLSLVPFEYGTTTVRTVTVEGQPWFVAADVCTVLGLSNPTMAMRAVDPDALSTAEAIDSMGRPQQVRIVSEAGLYELIFQSRKPEARPFRRWVTAEVLPQIRRTGQYGAPLALPTYAEALRQLADQVETTERQARELEAARPAVEFHERFVEADGNYKIGDVAKVLAIPGLGQNKLFGLLRAEGVLIGEGKSKNIPYQRHVDAGRFVVKVTTYADSKGVEHVGHTTYATPKGLDYIRKVVASLGIG